MKILLAGEGSDDLGSYAREPMFREPHEEGVLECLVRRIQPQSEISDGVCWKDVTKYRSGEHRHPETRTVLGLALTAFERKCVLVFSRDRDGYEEREHDVENGIEQAKKLFPDVVIVGGTANEEIESWILSMLGDRSAESHTNAKARLAKTHGISTRQEKVDIASKFDFSNAPEPAVSLRRWLERVGVALITK